MRNFQLSDFSYFFTAFSGQTSSYQIQSIIESKANKKLKKNTYTPEGNKKMIIFIDDINMPKIEKYGAQPPIELLRQWMDSKGFYDLETKEFKEYHNITIIGAMNPPSAGRNSISSRFSQKFCIIYLQPFSHQSLVTIFSTILKWILENKNADQKILNFSKNLVNSTIELYNAVKNSKYLLPTPNKSHYIYNLRDISKIFQGIMNISQKNLSNEIDFLKLWTHECMRTFQDRLIHYQDQEIFQNFLKDILKKNFQIFWNDFLPKSKILLFTYFGIF